MNIIYLHCITFLINMTLNVDGNGLLEVKKL